MAMRLEWRLFAIERASWALLGLFVALMLVASFNGRALVEHRVERAADLVTESGTIREGLARQAAAWDGEGKVPVAAAPGPVAFSVLTAWAVLAPTPLSALAIGQSDLLPPQYGVTARPAHTFLSDAELASPLALATGSFDVAFLVLYGVPILVIALLFNVASREREAGTLSLAAAQGMTPRKLITAKWLVRAVATLVVVALGVTASAAISGGTRALTSGDFGAWLVVAVSYAAFWLTLCLYVNALGYGSDRNGVILAGSWVMLIVIVPALAAITVATTLPPPSRVELTTLVREASDDADREAASAREKYLFDHPDLAGEDIDPDEFYRSVADTEATVTRAVAPALARFDSQAARQRSLVNGLQYLSPAMLAHQGLLVASGTDGARYADFRDQVTSFHAGWRDFFVSRLQAGKRLGASDYRQAPRFSHVDRLESAIRRVVLPVTALFGAALVLCLLAARRLRRLPIV